QAEDGIRAFHVTGVQTCALPICPGARLLLLGLSGADAGVLAEQSRALAEALAAHPGFEFVANGVDAGLDAVPEALRPYRYLLSPDRKSDAQGSTVAGGHIP